MRLSTTTLVGADFRIGDGEGLVLRSVDAQQTVEQLTDVATAAGVSRIADVTMLDVLGIPVWQAIRPLSRNLTVSQGKGLTNDQAKAGALMESIEMFFAESPPLDAVASLNDMAFTLGYEIHTLAREGEVPAGDEMIEWSRGWFLEDHQTTFLPRDLLNLDFTRSKLGRPWLLPTSNGLAGGNSSEEAVLHGLYEVVERHSLRVTSDQNEAPRSVDLDCFKSNSMRAVISACQRASLEVVIEDQTLQLGVPCFQARLLTADRLTEMSGSGAHCSAEVAALKALLEAVQSRLTVITGSRDDIDELDFCARGDSLSFNAFRAEASVFQYPKLDSLNDDGHPRATAELDILVEKLARFNYHPIVTELASEQGRFSVCFVVVPGLKL